MSLLYVLVCNYEYKIQSYLKFLFIFIVIVLIFFSQEKSFKDTKVKNCGKKNETINLKNYLIEIIL